MTTAACPLCQASASWQPELDFPGAFRCAGCSGFVLQQGASVRVVERLGVAPHVISTLAAETGRPSRIACPNGDGPLAHVTVKGAQLRLCLRCGLSVFHPGDLEALWQGQRPPPVVSGLHPAEPSPASVVEPVAPAIDLEVARDAPSPPEPGVPVEQESSPYVPPRGLFGALAELYGNTDPRQRLLVMVGAFSVLTTLGLFLAMEWSKAEATDEHGRLQRVAFHAQDCGAGGRVALIKAQQAARLGEVELVDELLETRNGSAVPMGTRCHVLGMALLAEAQANAKERP